MYNDEAIANTSTSYLPACLIVKMQTEERKERLKIVN